MVVAGAVTRDGTRRDTTMSYDVSDYYKDLPTAETYRIMLSDWTEYTPAQREEVQATIESTDFEGDDDYSDYDER